MRGNGQQVWLSRFFTNKLLSRGLGEQNYAAGNPMTTNCALPADRPLAWVKKPVSDSSIEEILADYRKIYLDDTERWIKSLVTYTDFICGARNQIEAPHLPQSVRFCKNRHQYRLPRATVKEAYCRLVSARLDKYSSFAAIYDAVIETTRSVHQFGVLAAYDFTQRYCYSRGIMPDGVYLHAGVTAGAEALKLLKCGLKISSHPLRGKMIEIESLPKVIAELGTFHAENYLCVYKEVLAKLVAKAE